MDMESHRPPSRRTDRGKVVMRIITMKKLHLRCEERRGSLSPFESQYKDACSKAHEKADEDRRV